MPVCDQIALNMRRETGSTISSATIVSYFEAFRKACVSHFNTHPVKLRTPGKVVKIVETALACKKKIKRGLFHISGVLERSSLAISALFLQLSTGMLLPLCRLCGSISSRLLLLCRISGHLITAFKS